MNPEQNDLPVGIMDDPSAPVAMPNPPTPPANRKPRKWLKYVVGAGVAIMAVFVLASLTTKKPNNNTNTSSPAPAAVAPVQTKDLPDSTATKTYENGPMGLALTHPDTWTATETADNGVRVESPVFSYPNLDKDPVSGNFRIYIRKGARAVDSKYIGRGVAIAPSEKLVYTKPAVGQRADTLLTNFGLDTTDNFAFFMIAGNFQLKEGDTLGPSYGKEPETFIVSGGYSSKDLKDDMATNQVPPDYIEKSNAYKQAIEIIKSLQLN